MRDLGLDALKGVAILVVVLSHTLQWRGGPQGLPPLGIIYSFSMPLFVYLSGFAVGYSMPRPLTETLRHKARTLLIPYVAWAVIHVAVSGAVPVGSGVSPSRYLFWLLSQGPWYLAAIFIFSLLILLPGMKQGGTRALIQTVLIVIAMREIGQLSIFAEWDLFPKMVRLFPLFVAGYLGNTNSNWRRAAQRPPTVALVVAYVACVALLWPVWGGSEFAVYVEGTRVFGRLTSPLVYMTVLVVHAIAGLSAALVIERIVRGANAVAIHVLGGLGGLSLGIYLTHIYFVRPLPGSGVAAAVCLAFVGVLGSGLLTWAISRIPVLRSVLLGGR